MYIYAETTMSSHRCDFWYTESVWHGGKVLGADDGEQKFASWLNHWLLLETDAEDWLAVKRLGETIYQLFSSSGFTDFIV